MIGIDLAIARLVLSITFGISMALIFHKEDVAHDQAADAMFAGQASMRRATVIFLLLLVALLAFQPAQ